MNKIAMQRRLFNISQAKLAEMINSRPSRISNFESLTRKPDLNTCWMIVNAFNKLGADCTFEDIFPNPKQHSNKEI
ncbi:helix-turn-helix transcriptional regulator [Photobacterium leiognathi]|uniref:helix-turn-helix transcriptional regulator n=1 Tax=Photobacterium leiognathi TaxID=553611 RepID=UPI002981F53E|nr:helix-turn-helix transcriptional regulator [Photobacterium leiognathi]